MTRPPAAHPHREVADATRRRTPVVALESTIISHGMPCTRRTSRWRPEVEGIIRDHGAVPATIAVLDGRPRVGLGAADDLELLNSHGDVTEGERADLLLVVARGTHGATTVAATMRLASPGSRSRDRRLGVHRGASRPSTSRPTHRVRQTNVAVVSGGEVDPRHRPDAGDPRDAGRPGARGRRQRRVPSFYSGQRPRRPEPCRHRRRGRDHVRSGGDSARRRRDRQPDPGGGRDPADEIGLIIDQALADTGSARHPRQGRDAVPPRPDRRDHRWRLAHREHRPGPPQRALGAAVIKRSWRRWPEPRGGPAPARNDAGLDRAGLTGGARSPLGDGQTSSSSRPAPFPPAGVRPSRVKPPNHDPTGRVRAARLFDQRAGGLIGSHRRLQRPRSRPGRPTSTCRVGRW